MRGALEIPHRVPLPLEKGNKDVKGEPQACCTAQHVEAGKDMGNQEREPRRKPIPTQAQVPQVQEQHSPQASWVGTTNSLPPGSQQRAAYLHLERRRFLKCWCTYCKASIDATGLPHTLLLTDTTCPSPCVLAQSPRVLPQPQATKEPHP